MQKLKLSFALCCRHWNQTQPFLAATRHRTPRPCAHGDQPLGDTWVLRGWGTIRSIKPWVTPGCRADGCTNPVQRRRRPFFDEEEIHYHNFLPSNWGVAAPTQDSSSHPRGTQASPKVLSNGSCPICAAPTYCRADRSQQARELVARSARDREQLAVAVSGCPTETSFLPCSPPLGPARLGCSGGQRAFWAPSALRPRIVERIAPNKRANS